MNVDQFADPYAEYRLAVAPDSNGGQSKRTKNVYLKYLTRSSFNSTDSTD